MRAALRELLGDDATTGQVTDVVYGSGCLGASRSRGIRSCAVTVPARHRLSDHAATAKPPVHWIFSDREGELQEADGLEADGLA